MIDTIVVGAGKWALECWVPLLNEYRDRYRVSAVVDPDRAHAEHLAGALGLEPSDTFVTVPDAVSQRPSAVAGIVLSSPEHHAGPIIDLANAGRHVLTEKPLATTSTDLARITEAVHAGDVQAAVIQNYRYQRRIQLARTLAASGELGPFHYLAARFAADYRQPESWDVGDAHTMNDPLLVEGSIHHLDMIRYLTGRNIDTITAYTANPTGSSFHGDCIGGALIRLDGGGFALYEASLLAAATENRWRNEYYRLEFEGGAITCDGPTVTVVRERSTRVHHVPDEDMFTGHRTLVTAFADWLEGGPAIETTIADNAFSIAAIFAAITSTRTGTPARVIVPATPSR
ncbi:MAG: Gfo/Idh/MocA family protein [Sciscionella sp.]